MSNEENILISGVLDIAAFNRKLKTWYLQNHRPLPWRQTTDPYKIWLSEIILQQTRVAQGMPYYERFVEHYPTVFDLAAADERDVLRLWQGLGYYSRARNMHYTAKQIVDEYGGRFPATAKGLAQLKGLGTYTAAAIASFAFGEQVAAIDGNVYRVMSRIFGIKQDILSNEGKKAFQQTAQMLVPADDPATYNQAMIEFGALQCVPVAPLCHFCVFSDICFAFEKGMQSQLPVKVKKLKIKQRFLNYLVFELDGELAMNEREGRDIWQGLYDFPVLESDQLTGTFEDLACDDSFLRLVQNSVIRQVAKVYTHILTHQRLSVQFWWIKISPAKRIDLPSSLTFYSRDQVEQLPKPILIQTFLQEEGYL